MRPKIFFLIWFIFLPLFLILIFDLFFGKYFFPNINETENIYIRHSIYHHTIKPNFNSELRWGKNLYTAYSNNLGFKSKCNIKANKNFDLAFIGDSFTEGVAYPYEKTFVAIIEKESKLKIANFAASSYSPIITTTDAPLLYSAMKAVGISATPLFILKPFSFKRRRSSFELFSS